MIPAPFSFPLYLMAKGAGAACNMACEYCYYLEKAGLTPDVKRTYMSDATLEEFTRQYIQSQSMDSVLFTWHGGEALLRPIEFYRRALEFQRRYAGGRHIENCIQTNGILLNDDWCRFFKENNWLVGISIDGPEEFHDEYRRSRDRSASFQRVMRGINLLRKHGVEWNAMAVVNDYNADFPEEFYDFFKSIDCKYLQFTPIVERKEQGRLASGRDTAGELCNFSVTPEQWGEFLCRVFDRWVREDVGRVFVQLFDATLANWVGVEPGICTMSRTCGHAGVVEFNGDVYGCDHFVFPEFKLGNIHTHSIVEMMTSPRQVEFGRAKESALPDQCKQCDVEFACHGECPKNRFAVTSNGQPGLNYLCEGYRRFFRHVRPYMDYMAEQLRREQPPANIMARLKEGDLS
ncbi:MAG: anaerobic sulfatase-maturation protein [Bacteroidales bacterium]|nr:anaerobic sulfatase-maturation protein [Bacteroidales bacterium]